MSMRRMVACVLVLALSSVPVAAAASEPAVYYLHRRDLTDPDQLIGGPLMSVDPPEDEAHMISPVTLGTDDLPTLLWTAADEEDRPTRIIGPLFVGLFRGQEALSDGNMSAVLYEVASDDTRTVLAKASLHVNITEDPEQTPDPTTIVPPNPDPTDPEGAAMHAAAKLLPMVLEAPLVFNFGFVNLELQNGSKLALGLFLEEDEEGNVPAGTIPLYYDGTLLAPSFLFVPWFRENPAPPPVPEPPAPQPQPPAPQPQPEPEPEPEDDEPNKDSPGVGILAALALVGLAGYLARRRT